MTNREVKLELAKAALHNPNVAPTDESIKELYNWIMEDEGGEKERKKI